MTQEPAPPKPEAMAGWPAATDPWPAEAEARVSTSPVGRERRPAAKGWHRWQRWSPGKDRTAPPLAGAGLRPPEKHRHSEHQIQPSAPRHVQLNASYGALNDREHGYRSSERQSEQLPPHLATAASVESGGPVPAPCLVPGADSHNWSATKRPNQNWELGEPRPHLRRLQRDAALALPWPAQPPQRSRFKDDRHDQPALISLRRVRPKDQCPGTRHR